MEKIDLLITLTADERDSNNVTIAFTVGLKALEQGKSVTVLLLSHGVALAGDGYADKIDIGAPFRPVKDLLKDYLDKGGKVASCLACMKHNSVPEDSVFSQVEIVNADFIVDAPFAAEKTLQLN